ncbi:MAG: hypothetical protein KDA69_08140 [Planctomycetaceae bacterium]|nr:hypothetical protein [Planctomycetaceae bacterium]MCA9044274.1 hypothetical protein [Planctomycetaceae bacterium]MCB9952802.1 hypothetical protein [Planctomycetaceae bacterium]
MREIEVKLSVAIGLGNVADVKSLCSSHPELRTDYVSDGQRTWLNMAAKRDVRVVEALLDLGYDIDVLRLPEESTCLGTAISFKNDEAVELLLRRGANPNLDRTVIRAMNSSIGHERTIGYLILLIEHGVDLNQVFPLYKKWENAFTALDWADDPEVYELLRSRGAKTLDELKQEGWKPPVDSLSQT